MFQQESEMRDQNYYIQNQQEESKNEQDNLRILKPLGFSTLDVNKFEKVVLNEKENIIHTILQKSKQMMKQEKNNQLINLCGSRSYFWRVFLGLIPDCGMQDKNKLLRQLHQHRISYFKKLKAVLQFRDQMIEMQMALTPLLELQQQTKKISMDAFQKQETLNQNSVQNEINFIVKDKELREIIKQDIDRTLQDIDFFTKQEIKDNLSNILYLWSKDNSDFSYRQGMNEILAVLVYQFFSEIIQDSGSKYQTFSDQYIQNMQSQDIIQYIFSNKYVYADIYWCFERLMSLGIRNLYQITKDLATLKQEIFQEMGIAIPANNQRIDYHSSTSNNQIDQKVREKLEEAYESEKMKSVIVRKCMRIYNEILKSEDNELWNHLINTNQISPELQLMRWLRCILSREFSIEVTLQLWEFILVGVYTQFIKYNQENLLIEQNIGDNIIMIPFSFKEQFKVTDSLPKLLNDPLINLDILCVCMILNKKQLLMESDFSMCLAYLLNFEFSSDPSELIEHAMRIKIKIQNRQQKNIKQKLIINQQKSEIQNNKQLNNSLDIETEEFSNSEYDEQYSDQQKHQNSQNMMKKQTPVAKNPRRIFPFLSYSKTQNEQKINNEKYKSQIVSVQQNYDDTNEDPLGPKQSMTSRNIKASSQLLQQQSSVKQSMSIDRRNLQSEQGKEVQKVQVINPTQQKINQTKKKSNKLLQKEVQEQKDAVIQKQMDFLNEQNLKNKMQIKNAIKILMKVDDYLIKTQGKKQEKEIDQNKLNSVITDLRDALNILNKC